MRSVPFDQIDKAYIDGLIEEQVSETKHLDYKEVLPSADKGKNRFAEDVCAFANAAGGDIIFGLRDRRDAEGQKTGTPEYVGLEGLNSDQEKLRLEHIILNRVEPRIAGIQIACIEGFVGGPVLVMRIPSSFNAPHMTKHDGRFRSRTESGNYAMDVQEIRNAFTSSEALPERIRRFRANRLNRIVAGDTSVPISRGGKIVLHIVPVSAFLGGGPRDIARMEGSLRLRLPLINGYLDDWRYNLEGLLAIGHMGNTRRASSYTQLFRDGSIEAVDSSMLEADGDRLLIPSVDYESQLLDRIQKYISLVGDLGVDPPLLIMLSLVEVAGYELDTARRLHVGQRPVIDRDTIVVPEVLLEKYENNMGRVMRPAFDIVCNACGHPCSMNYNEEGKWFPCR